MDEIESREKLKGPPNMSPVTLTNFVETHRRTLPRRMDRSMMKSVSGSDQARILGALDFLDLTRDNGRPTHKFEALRDAGEDESGLKAVWADIVRQAYPLMFEDFDLSSATQAMIDERFRDEFSIQGDTVRKAVAFFLALARLAEIPLSTYVKATRPRGPGRPPGSQKRGPATAKKPKDAPPATTTVEEPAHGTTRTVALRNGAGSVSVTVSLDLWELEGEDRAFVFGLMDDLKTYEKGEDPALRFRLPQHGAAES
jgi:hypothetical protein